VAVVDDEMGKERFSTTEVVVVGVDAVDDDILFYYFEGEMAVIKL
jgi:hypothetical protein